MGVLGLFVVYLFYLFFFFAVSAFWVLVLFSPIFFFKVLVTKQNCNTCCYHQFLFVFSVYTFFLPNCCWFCCHCCSVCGCLENRLLYKFITRVWLTLSFVFFSYLRQSCSSFFLKSCFLWNLTFSGFRKEGRPIKKVLEICFL